MPFNDFHPSWVYSPANTSARVREPIRLEDIPMPDSPVTVARETPILPDPDLGAYIPLQRSYPYWDSAGRPLMSDHPVFRYDEAPILPQSPLIIPTLRLDTDLPVREESAFRLVDSPCEPEPLTALERILADDLF